MKDMRENLVSSRVTMFQVLLLHSRADRALRLIVAKQLERFNITMMEWLLIGSVCRGPKQGMTMTDVATKLDVTLPQVTALITNLTKNKLLRQKISSLDRRSRRLIITSVGRKLLDSIDHDLENVLKLWVRDIPTDRWQAYLNVVEVFANQKLGNG